MGGLQLPLRLSALVLFLTVTLAGCSTMSGPERIARVDQLVADQEYGKAETLLTDIDARDAEFEELVVRRRALRPLIVQFEERTLRKVESLKKTDDWPAAEAMIQDARGKLPRSATLQMVEEQFYADRSARLEQLNREMNILLAEHLSAKTPLVHQITQIHPGAIKSRWQSFRHHREREDLARQLLNCSDQALQESRFELAESCLKMAAELTDDEAIQSQLAALQQRHGEKQQQVQRRAEAQEEAEMAASEAHTVEQLEDLKFRYRYLMDAGWLAAAREILAELQNRAPDDPEVAEWTVLLQALIDTRVADQIAEGQALYSAGRLREALAVWRDAEKLAPNNTVLQAHITRVERFIAKLERLDSEDGV